MMNDRRKDKYGDMGQLAAFGFLANAMEPGGRYGDGDRGASFPRSDAEDLSRGLRFIPGEVTVARRQGERVNFIQDCGNPICWYWQFPDGSRTYYWERYAYEQTAAANGIESDGESDLGQREYSNGIGVCPACGNKHLSGGHIKAADL